MSQFNKNTRSYQPVRVGQSVVNDTYGIEDIVHLVGKVQQDVCINGQARWLHGRRAIQRRAGANVGAGRS